MIVNWTDNQKLAINEESRDLIVTASAGSGKTSAMVARALALIKKGVPVTRLMLLTFGEAAAAEMREKLRNALIDYAKVAVDNIDFIREQIDDMARTDISTIHSFCKGIIKNNFETVGLSPGFEVSDKETAEVLARKAIKNLLEAEGAKKNNTQFAELREMLSPRNDDTLIKIIRNIYDYMATQADRESWLNNTFADEYYVGLEESAAAKYTVEFIKKEATIISSRAAELQKSATFLGEDIYINNSQYLYERVCGYLNCISLKDIYIEREREYIIKWRNLRDNAKNSSLYKITQELKEEVSSFNALIRSMLGDYSYEEADSVRLGSAVQVSELIRLVKAYDVEFSKIKRENNVLDFADLEKFALLVLNNQQKREEIVKEHDYVFVDEYQDTNFVQESIISKVAPENALFMVGDSKQCIYRFRLAEPNIFLDKLKQLCQQGKAISFNDNFRSSPLILGFVNDVFGELMTEGLGGVAYAKDAAFNIPKEYHRVSAYPEVQISAVISARDEEDEEQEASQVSKCVYSVKEAQSFCSSKKGIAEGREIAAKIMSLVGREHINDKGVIRLIEYSDIALMFKQRSNANGILSELTSCSIPLRLGVFAAAEQSEDVALLINYIKFLDNRKEDYTLIAVMHSRLCNFSNEELAEIRRRRDKIPFYQAAELCAEDTDSLGSKLKDFYNAADNYCFEAQFTNVNALIASIIEQSGYGDYVLSLTGGKDRMIALEYFLRGLESKSFCRSVAAFVDYYTEHEEDIEWGKGDMSAENGVNVCTIHASKGLEYPVVILAGTGCYMNKSGRQSPTQVDKTLGIGMNYYDKKTRCIIPSIVMNAIANKKKIEEREDALRLFYVALTRAKSHLIITGAISDNKYSKTASVNKATSYFEWLLAVAQKVKSVAGLINLYRIRADISEAVEEKKVFFGAPSPDIAEKISREFEYNYPYKSSVDVGIKYSATGINKEEDIVIPSLFEEERRIRGVDYHKIMQYIDYNCATLEEISAELKRMLSEGLISDEECASVDMYDILKCLSSPVMRYAGLNKCLREQRFMLAEYANEVKDTLAKDQILIQGTIDLVILGEETVIVDFKYSRLTDDVLKQKYATQLKIYKKAVESGMNIKVDKLILYIFGTGKVITL